jgi:hypothetical protein
MAARMGSKWKTTQSITRNWGTGEFHHKKGEHVIMLPFAIQCDQRLLQEVLLGRALPWLDDRDFPDP